MNKQRFVSILLVSGHGARALIELCPSCANNPSSRLPPQAPATAAPATVAPGHRRPGSPGRAYGNIDVVFHSTTS